MSWRLTKRVVIGTVSVALAPIVVATVIVTVATATGAARPR